jgi:hypothetical protein
LTVDDVERSNDLHYTIKTNEQTPDVLNIPANVINSNVQGCSTTTTLEYLDPESDFIEAKEKEGHVTFNYDIDGNLVSVDFQTKMDWYITDLVSTFGQLTATGGLPNDVQIELRFVTRDDVDPEKVKYDLFVLTITGTTETEDDFCDWTGLSLKNPMSSGDREWYVPDSGTLIEEPMELWISPTLEGKETLSSNCQGLIYMTIDLELANGRWETVGDEWSFEYGRYDEDSHIWF